MRKPRLNEKFNQYLLTAWVGFALSSTCLAVEAAAVELERQFLHPPAGAKPWVHCFWVDGNISREGITADLEAMARVGIGGMVLMDVTQEVPPGPVPFGTDTWYSLVQHTISEAARLGLEFSMNNDPGWTGSGGPWITPDLAMQKLVWSITNVTGPSAIKIQLPALPAWRGFNRDVAVIAFPTLVGDGASIPDIRPSIALGRTGKQDPGNLLDGDLSTVASVKTPGWFGHSEILLDYGEPFAASELLLKTTAVAQSFQGTLEISDEGKTFRKIRDFGSVNGGLALQFEMVEARFYRIRFATADAPQSLLVFSEIELTPVYRIPHYQAKSGMAKTFPVNDSKVEFPPYSQIPLSNVVDLSSRLSADATLTWDVPPGRWSLLRFGYMPTGRMNHPARPGGHGLECDKLNPHALDAHFAGMLGRMIRENPAAAGNTFIAIHGDSWEMGFQNWTPYFREDFIRLRNYDPLPYLPAFSGRVVENGRVSERFLWDVRRTIADLFADNYAGRLAELARQQGMWLSLEAYGNGPFDDLLYASRADVPMSEFWNETDDPAKFHTSKTMSSAAHVYGKRIVAAEAFTAWPFDSGWRHHPFSFKWLGDTAFIYGVNRLVLHRFVHQPWLELRPGMTLGMWGSHYERTQTWWEQSKAWHTYLARCQALLQSGLFVADVCYLTPETAFTDPPSRAQLRPALPAGYDYDVAHPEALFTRMSVTNGRVRLPDGMEYRVVVLTDSTRATPQFLRKLRELVIDGATIIGARPISSPSLENYPQCDAQVTAIADELWGKCDGKQVTENRLGKGRVLWGRSLEDVFSEINLPPDFHQSDSQGKAWRAIHRRVAQAEVYFVTNPDTNTALAECEFRVTGMAPELWHPDTGMIESPARWRQDGATTTMPLKLDPAGSVFVVFRKPNENIDGIARVVRNGADDLETELLLGDSQLKLRGFAPGDFEVSFNSGRKVSLIVSNLPGPPALNGQWKVEFPPGLGAPEGITLDGLRSLSLHDDAGVRFFSGTATYKNTFDLSASDIQSHLGLWLDLGQVRFLAAVSINGNEAGIVWKPPFRMDITSLVSPGRNVLEISVANLWINRFIGDDYLPEDCSWNGQTPGSTGNALVEWPGWLLRKEARPTARVTFATRRLYTKDSPLPESGLLGPVRLHWQHETVLK